MIQILLDSLWPELQNMLYLEDSLYILFCGIVKKLFFQ
jgi:hypothetical protein